MMTGVVDTFTLMDAGVGPVTAPENCGKPN